MAILLNGIGKLKSFKDETNLNVFGKDLPKTLSKLIEKEALKIMSPEDALKVSSAILKIMEISLEMEQTNIQTATIEEIQKLADTARIASNDIKTVLRRLQND